MALTSPDNIWTPDSSDNYALTTDLAATADSVQDAITALRGNNAPTVRVANVAGRTAALAAHGTPTTSNPLIVFRADAGAGRELEYTTNGTTWHTLVAEQDTGWVDLTPSSTYNNTGGQLRRLNGVVYGRGTLTRKSGNVSLGDTFAHIPEQFRPSFSRNFISHGQGALNYRVVLQGSDGRLYCNSTPEGVPTYIQLDAVVFAL